MNLGRIAAYAELEGANDIKLHVYTNDTVNI